VTQLPGSRSVEAHLERRIALGVLLIVAVWLLLLVRLFHMQVVEGDRYWDSAQKNSVRTHRVKAPRGIILDRTGAILTDSRPSYNVLVVPHETQEMEQTLVRVANLAGVDPGPLRERVGEPRGRARFQPQEVARDLQRPAVARVEARLWAMPGVLSQVAPIREYRYGNIAAHVLGWLGEISPNELEKRAFQGYRSGENVGKGGVERLLDRELRGRDGGENVLVDAHGRELELLDAVEPQPGQRVVLTLDHRLQSVAESALQKTERNGAVVALDPRNGEVLVLVSQPSFDPNRFARGIEKEEWQQLVEDPGKPLHNRALLGQYPPGSTYKVVTAIAGLEKGVIRPGFTVKCVGSHRLGRRRYRCWKRGGHGVVALHRALVESCDVFFYVVGHEVGIDELAYYGRALGLGSPTGIEVGREGAGLVPTRAWKERRFGEVWLAGETLSASIGQGFNLWTPIQLASVYAAIGNGGTRYRPFVVREIADPHGRLVRETQPESKGRLPLSPGTLEQVQSALHGVVHEPHGTGYAMRGLPGGVEAAGKTGTAQVVTLAKDPPKDDDEIPIERRDHAWFVTYAPAEAPRIAVAVLVEHGGHGGSAAGPIAAEVVATFLENETEARIAGELEAAAELFGPLPAPVPAAAAALEAGEVVLAGD
jgi:penicillin-binding protein 2